YLGEIKLGFYLGIIRWRDLVLFVFLIVFVAFAASFSGDWALFLFLLFFFHFWLGWQLHFRGHGTGAINNEDNAIADGFNTEEGRWLAAHGGGRGILFLGFVGANLALSFGPMAPPDWIKVGLGIGDRAARAGCEALDALVFKFLDGVRQSINQLESRATIKDPRGNCAGRNHSDWVLFPILVMHAQESLNGF